MTFVQISQEEQEKIVKLISTFFPKAKIYLFGSYARGTATKSSDLDIAIDNGDLIESFSALGEIQDVLNAMYVPYKIEIVDFHGANTSMQELILEEGVVWRN